MSTSGEPVDKLALVVGGRTLLQRVVDAARASGAHPVICVGPAHTADGRAGLVVVSEDPPGGGPAAAVAAGLSGVDQPIVILLGGDLPFVEPPALQSLVGHLEADQHHAGVVAVDGDGRYQWLLSAWRAAALRDAFDRLAGDLAGRPLRSVLEPLSPTTTLLPPGPAPLPAWFDCDTPADLESARRAIGEG